MKHSGVGTSTLLSVPILGYIVYWKSITAMAYESPSLKRTQFHVAPMQGYTNAQTRKMFDLLSPSSIKWTEMEKMDDIFPQTESVDYLFDALGKRLGPPDKYQDTKHPDDDASNLVLQIGTNDPNRLQAFVKHTIERYDNIKEINLNCGCPSIESGGASTYGASLMKDAELTGELVRAAREGMQEHQSTSHPTTGVSVKCRIGVFESENDMRPLGESDYEYLKNYISTIHERGADSVILHARPAVLSGLSPVKNRIIPTLNYDFVETIATEFAGEMDITLNGGITTLSQLQSFQNNNESKVSGHMAGRWCLRRPLDLVCIEALLKGKDLNAIAAGSSSLHTVKRAIEEYIDDAMLTHSSSSSAIHKPSIAEICLPLFLITAQLKDDYDFEEDDLPEGSIAEGPVLHYDDIETLYDVLQDGIGEIEKKFDAGKKKKKKQNGDMNFNRLSSSFKSLVGTKVANKWKRNRAEL